MAAVAVAIRTGVAPSEWMDDPRALVTAVHIITEMDRRNRHR